jgi:hypothetical protein
MPKCTPTKNQENAPSVDACLSPAKLNLSPIAFKSPTQKTSSPLQELSPASLQRMAMKQKPSLSKITKNTPPSSGATGKKKAITADKRVTQSPSMKQMLKMVLKSPVSEKKISARISQATTPVHKDLTPRKRNFIARRLFSSTKKDSKDGQNTCIETDICAADLKSDLSYFPSCISSRELEIDDDFTGSSCMCCSDDEEDENLEELIDTFGIDAVSSKFTPRKSKGSVTPRRRQGEGKDSLSRKDSKLHLFLKNRLPSFRKESSGQQPQEYFNPNVPDMFQALDDDELSVADAIIKEWESKQMSKM